MKVAELWRYPAKGTRIVLSAEQVGLLGGDFDFTKLGVEYTTFFKLREDALGRKSGNGAAHVGAAYDAGLKELREARDAARVAFQEIRFASEAEGLELKPAMQAAWMRMQSALEEVNAALARSKTP